MPPYLQRKYADLIHKVSSKWVNWDPPIEIGVGAYGTVDRATGDLLVEGNIYDPEFQSQLDKHSIKINLANFPPQEGPTEDDFIISSGGARRMELGTNRGEDAPGIINAPIKGQWSFERGKRDAVLIMHRPRQVYLPSRVVLEHLYHVDKLIDKWLVTSIHTCPAYSMYLSDKSGGKFSLALVAQASSEGIATASANNGFGWWDNAQTGVLRKACDQMGRYVFTPLYALRRPLGRLQRFFRDEIPLEPKGDDLWYNDNTPWDPLDEDGEEDAIDTEVEAVDPQAY